MSDMAEKDTVLGTGIPSANVKHYPVGTLDELRDVCNNDADRFEHARKVYATCSMPGPDNRGCAFYKKCEFKKLRGVAGPRRFGVLQAIMNGAAAVRVMPCFVYMAVMHPIKKLSRSQAVRVVAQEGDIVNVKETVRINKKDPKDPRHQLVRRKRVIKPFPRPDVTMAELKFTMEALADAEAARAQERDETIFRGATFVGEMADLVETAGIVEKPSTEPATEDDVELT